ncbi:MAG: glycoside hydrolase family 13 protein [Microbacterium sp.]|uniref:glycoside hydrolase family 13 protein n=1 Tax=Microbacterium sp. TaxID=51671 RepID=UPI0039E69869
MSAIEQWWVDAVVYQIYPRSFADSNGDGIGDIRGISSRVPYLSSLGIDAVWLSPFYPSALADGGYDVDDYRDVDPRLGTLDDFDELVDRLHAAGIRLLVDIVANHTSSRHPWFVEALASPRGSAARDRYHFQDGRGPGGGEPPSDWESMFGGSIWERVHSSGREPDQWYFHIFAREQPDLNWDHPDVRADFIRTIRFWADRGVDGFRVDVAHALAKDLTPPLPAWRDIHVADAIADGFENGSHPYWDRDDVHAIYAEWRQVFDAYDPPRTAVAEAWVHSSRRERYASGSGLGQVFNFDLLQANFDANAFRTTIRRNLDAADTASTSSTWVLSNHDVVRHASRFGLPAGPWKGGPVDQWRKSRGIAPELDSAMGERRARAATLLVLALPGSVYLFQGEELGLHDVPDIPDELRQDPTFARTAGADPGRDGARVPLPWTAARPTFGFGGRPQLPQPNWFAQYAVAEQAGTPGSTLEMYRQALDIRRRLRGTDAVTWVEDAPKDVVHFARAGGWHSVTNFGDTPVTMPSGSLMLASGEVTGRDLPPATTVWLLDANRS